MRRLSLRLWLASLIGVVVVPLVGLLAYHVWVDTESDAQRARSRVLFAAQQVARKTRAQLDDMQGQLAALAQRPGIQALDPNACDPLFGESRAIFPRFANVVTLDATGELVCSMVAPAAGRPTRVDPQYYLAELLRTRSFTIGRPAKGFVTGRWVVTLAQPILGQDGEVRGVLAFALDLLHFWSGPNALEMPLGSRSRIYDGDGTFLASSEDPEQWVGAKARPAMLELARAHEQGTVRDVDRFGVERFYGFARVPGTSWLVSIGIPTASVLEQTGEAIARDAAVASVVVLAALLLSFFLARRIIRPVEAVVGSFKQWAAGRTRRPAPFEGPAEMATLAGEFDAALEQLERAEAGRRASEERAHTILRTALDGLLIIGSDGRLVETNAAYARMTGYSAAELAAMRVRDLEAVESPEAVADHMRLLAERGEDRFETRHRRKDGSIVDVEISATVQGNGDVVSFVRDVTERNRVEALLAAHQRELESQVAQRTAALAASEQSLRELTQTLEAKVAARTAELTAASAAKSIFLANMSHEIRNPLNVILGLAQLLEQKLADREDRESVRQIRDAGDVLLHNLNDVLDLSKIEAGRLEIEQSPFRIAELLAVVERIAASLATTKGIALRIDAAAAGDLRLRGDAVRVQQVLINLLSNAIKFTDRGGVVLSVAPAETSAGAVRMRFEVRDTGIGIPAATLATLFTPFTQADASITRRFGGTGLGLAISKRLVERMGGTIGAESAEGLGSTFWFELPFPVLREPGAGTVAQDAPREFGEPALEAACRGLRVLVVDDHPMNLDIVERILAREGADVTRAVHGREALDLLAARPEGFDVVLMDVQMPVMDGLTATRAIRADPRLRRLPVIALTAGVMAEEREAARQAGVDDLLRKPIDVKSLRAMLARFARP